MCDVVFYLAGVAELPDDANRTFDAGAPDTRGCDAMMHNYERTGLLPRLLSCGVLLSPYAA